MNITVFGATGMLGTLVVQALVDSGFDVTAMVRHTQYGRLLPDDVRVIPGDLKNKEDVQKATEQAEAVYISLSVRPSSRESDFQPEREGIDHIIEAAQTTGVRVIGYLSSLVQRYQAADHFDWWVFTLKNEAVRKIKDSGIPYLLFYPSTFMENFDKGQFRQGNRINLAGTSQHPMYFIAGEDYARQVTAAFRRFKGKSKEYVVQGPEAYTTDEAAHIFVENYPKEKLKIVKLPFGLLHLLGKLTPTFHYGAHIVKALNHYPETFQAQPTWDELERPQITLKDYARQAE